MAIGVLALQGDVAEHLRVLGSLGVVARPVRGPGDLEGLEGMVLPGGESTTLSLLLGSSGLEAPLGEAVHRGMPVLGTCAGMILLARTVLDGRPDQVSFGALDVTVRRNGFGRQRRSFECDIAVTGFDDPVHAVFIRAPVVESVGPSVEVLARVGGSPVLCRQGPLLTATFHPELTGDDRVHGLFLAMVAEAATGSGTRRAGDVRDGQGDEVGAPIGAVGGAEAEVGEQEADVSRDGEVQGRVPVTVPGEER